jgi:tRNA threonylcarbamoyladenosine biosynthesis protein TsaB
MLLAIDTATRIAGLALYDEVQGWILGEEMWHSVDNHSVELMPRLVRMLALHGLAPRNLTGLVVSLGPGSFTGVRIALSLAKGLALACHLPLVGIPTLDVVAEPHKAQDLPIWAVLRAGRGRICAGNYVHHRNRWRRRGPMLLTTWSELLEQILEPVLFCGEIDAREAETIRQRLGEVVLLVTPAGAPRRAGYLAELGWRRLARGDADETATLAPIYLPQPQIDA